MESRNNTFIENINMKYNQYKKDVLSTNLGENICKTMNNKTKQTIFKYQEFLFNYMKDLNDYSNNNNNKELDNRGLLIFHGLGSGKTTSGILLSESCRNYNLDKEQEHYKTKDEYKRKVILMIPANLFFDPWIKEISSKCFQNCEIRDAIIKILKKDEKEKKQKKKIIEKLIEFDYHIIHYNAHSVKGGYKDKLLNINSRKNSLNKYTNKFSVRNNVFDDCVIIIDEMHNFMNMICNKLKEEKTVDIYNDLKNCQNSRIFLLSATPIINDPFEIAIISNILRGNLKNKNIKFHDNYLQFQENFINLELKNINNQNMLKRRLNGIISYNKGINEKVFATKIEEDIYVPFSSSQEQGYRTAEKLKGQSKDNIDKFDTSTLFKRKASNVILPNYLFDLKKLKKKKLKKNKNELKLDMIMKPDKKTNKKWWENKFNLLNETVTDDIQKQIIKILDNDDKPLHIDNELADISKKVYHIVKKIKESNGPVLVFSSFVKIYGIQFIAEALKQNGFTNFNDKKNKKPGPNGTFIKWTGNERNIKSKETFNDLKNQNGKIIKVFLMTKAGKEGINLLSVRQIHILEPWWNDTLIKQVVGRGIRICSHDHINKKDFIDFRFKKELRTYNNRIVNVFKYYGFIDLRNDTDYSKKLLIQRMKNRSIDYHMKTVADNKEKFKKILLSLMKEIAIDCNINALRNNENIFCYIDKNHKDYFDSWDVKDNEILTIKKKYKILKKNNLLFFLDQFDNIYKLKNNNTNIDLKNLDKDIIKIGTYKNKKIIFSNNYYKKEIIHEYKQKLIPKKSKKPNISTLLKKDLKKLLIDNQHLSVNQILQKIVDKYSGIDSQIKKDIKKNIKKYVKKMIKKNNQPQAPLPSNLRNSPMTPQNNTPQIPTPSPDSIPNRTGIRNIDECMKMIMKVIKKSKEYKELPKNIGKSKLGKKKLCKALNKN
jgi:superfamily II DNA or RNA helicase